MFTELLAHPGVEERCELRSSFGLMAFHGGNLERGTDAIAAAAAAASGASLYAVVQPAELRWHVPSTAFDPEASLPLARFIDHVAVVVAVHGYGRKGLWTTLLLGGGNRALAATLGSELRCRLPGFTVEADLEAIPAELRGVHPANPVNLPRCGGVQLELPPRVRGQAPTSEAWHVEAIVDALTATATLFAASP
ncbi:MAG: poly-gamma-glutamate hydrolase family protein [Acidimicrobiales bacterium]